MDRYNKFNSFLKKKFGERVLKICINGGFTCPNRDGKKGFGGCVFCGEKGSGERTLCGSIKTQIETYLASYRANRAQKHIIYFQNFTNTYDNIANLKRKYDEAVNYPSVVALAIATRPDCINEDIAKLIASYKEKGLYVWVELGLQTVNENVGQVINRCYTNNDFIKALNLLRKYGIDVVTHIMLGLPGEEKEDINNFIKFINSHDIQGLKIHSTYVIKNTKLEEMYNQKKYTPIEIDDYIDKVIHIITRIKNSVVIHRITGDAPKDLLVAPTWTAHKKLVLNRVENIMKENNLFQGCKFF